ncbi:uncharacterized protein LOC135847600 isoform X2 [Planococcus citri]|uniref:uncharacterized protein LOC135847600 isoform X2 n=1 Tax=Planococcus citri TaxID=170843 RepID=UPI0031F7CD7B
MYSGTRTSLSFYLLAARMKIKVVLTYFFIWLTIFGSSWQDGFNFYKGISSRYKVPLSKRLFYDGFNEWKNTNEKRNRDFIAILFNWDADMKFHGPNNENPEDECEKMVNSIPDSIFV